MPTAKPVSFTVHADRQLGEISPLWFGHNLEHTRRSARAMGPEETDAPGEWTRGAWGPWD